MKMIGTSKFLGLALKDHSIVAAELRQTRDHTEIGHTAEFSFTSELSWDKPGPLGAALRRFLRQNHFSASRAVVGIPAKWLMARQKDIPPATAQLAATALRIQAERDFPPELKELVFDYAGKADPGKPRKVLLVALLRQHLSNVLTMAEEAGVSLIAVTSSTLTLSSAVNGAPGADISLVLASDAAELSARGEDAPRLLRYLPVMGLGCSSNGSQETGGIAALGAEIQRAILLLSQNNAATSPRSLLLWDGIGLDHEAISTLGRRAGMQVLLGDLKPLGIVSPQDQPPQAGRFGAAIALARMGARPEALAINFLQPRLAPPKVRRLNRKTAWTAFIVTVLLAVIAFLVVDVQRSQAQLDQMKASLQQMQPAVQAAESLAKRVSFAQGWFDTRPPCLACLRQLTEAFPAEGSVWATSFSIRDNRKGLLSGKAADQKSILAVIDRLKTSKDFADVKLMDMREASGKTRDVSFSLSFSFNGVER